MQSWRAARAAAPELFADIIVWSQPAAVVDGIVSHWQQELESKEYMQATNLVDLFSAAWTDVSLQTAFVTQRYQTGVAAGCTSLTQVTDVGGSLQQVERGSQIQDEAES